MSKKTTAPKKPKKLSEREARLYLALLKVTNTAEFREFVLTAYLPTICLKTREVSWADAADADDRYCDFVKDFANNIHSWTR